MLCSSYIDIDSGITCTTISKVFSSFNRNHILQPLQLWRYTLFTQPNEEVNGCHSYIFLSFHSHNKSVKLALYLIYSHLASSLPFSFFICLPKRMWKQFLKIMQTTKNQEETLTASTNAIYCFTFIFSSQFLWNIDICAITYYTRLCLISFPF